MTREEFIVNWGRKAATKLKAESVNPDDIDAVRATLLATVGGKRIYEVWLKWHKQGEVSP